MICPNCGHGNPAEARFCGQCGTPLAQDGDSAPCPICGEDNPFTARYCHGCGAVLAESCPQCRRRHSGVRLFCLWCEQLLSGPAGVKAAGIGRRVAAYVLDAVLFFVTLIVGYIIWLGFSMRHGQTPGKQLLGIRVIRADGTASTWGWTFVREIVVKGLIIGLGVDSITYGLGTLFDGLWAFWDRDRQAIHDKIVKTLVVDDRQLRAQPVAPPYTTT